MSIFPTNDIDKNKNISKSINKLTASSPRTFTRFHKKFVSIKVYNVRIVSKMYKIIKIEFLLDQTNFYLNSAIVGRLSDLRS